MRRRSRLGTLGLVTFLALSAGHAEAGVMPNGLMPNGLMPNGLMPNGLMPNGLMPNGLMPNGLMPNGLMPNGLMPNGLMPNGLMPNGLMPNGLRSYSVYGDMFAVVNGSPVTFDQWFAVDPAARSDFMKYFVRCAYGPDMEVTYRSSAPAAAEVSSREDYAEGDGEKCDHHRDDSEGRDRPRYSWPGFFGLAQTSLDAGLQMTVDESKWVSSCMLAFVNTKGTHQYLSLRLNAGANAPNATAAAALAATPSENRTMPRQFGAFMADLASPNPTKYACMGHFRNPYGVFVEGVLGRTCDTGDCTYVDPAGQLQRLLTGHLGGCGDSASPITWDTAKDATIGGETYHPIVVFGPDLGEFESARPSSYEFLSFTGTSVIDVATCSKTYQWPGMPPMGGKCFPADAHFTTTIDPASQKASCPNGECLGNAMGLNDPIYGPESGKLVGLVDGQAVDGSLHAGGTLDPAEAFTAIVRYTKARTASANIWTSTQGGAWRDVTALGDGTGPDVWKSTGTSTQFEWLQVYPVYPDYTALESGSGLKIRISGAAMSESCTGPELFKGGNEQGICDKIFTGPVRNNTVCPKEFERAPACLGKLVWQKKRGVWGWYCRGGGEAIYACTADDAPELDSFGFVPGKPWCMGAGATSFVGVCK